MGRWTGRRSVAPFAFGIGLLAALYAFGETSGGHFNPIVSLALFLDRRLPAAEVLWRWVAQFAGAVLACLALLLMSSSDETIARRRRCRGHTESEERSSPSSSARRSS